MEAVRSSEKLDIIGVTSSPSSPSSVNSAGSYTPQSARQNDVRSLGSPAGSIGFNAPQGLVTPIGMLPVYLSTSIPGGSMGVAYPTRPGVVIPATQSVSLPRPLPSAAYPLAPTTLRLTGISATALHSATCKALSGSNVDFDYSAAKFKAHCFAYTPDGPCYFITRCYVAPSPLVSGGIVGIGQDKADFLVEFQRQRGDPVAFAQAYTRARASLQQQGLAARAIGENSLVDDTTGTGTSSLHASLIQQDNAAWAREQEQDATSSSSSTSPRSNVMQITRAFGPDGLVDTLRMLLATLSSPSAGESAVASVLWAIANMTRSDRFVHTCGAALASGHGPDSGHGPEERVSSGAASTTRPLAPQFQSLGAAEATDTLMQCLVARACAHVPPHGASLTIESRTAAAMSLANLCADAGIASTMLRGGPGCPTLHMLLSVANALPMQADCVHARRELVRVVAACASAMRNNSRAPGCGSMPADLPPELTDRLSRLRARAQAVGDTRMLEVLHMVAPQG